MLSSLIGLLGLYFLELIAGSKFINSWYVNGGRLAWQPARAIVMANTTSFFILCCWDFSGGIVCGGKFLRIVGVGLLCWDRVKRSR